MIRPDSLTTGTSEATAEQANRVNPLLKTADSEGLRSFSGITHAGSTTRDEAAAGPLRRPLKAGEKFDHFVLLRPLGEGGFGQVWLATDMRLGRDVAIKLPHRRWRPDSLEARRFQREAEVAAKLTHPNLVPILDAELDNDRAYIVSGYCPGPTLSQWLRDRNAPVPARLAVSIVAQLADGLKVAHDRGLIHRDIKPSNIILTHAESDSPVPRLTDFGLARTSADAPDTHVGTLIGSVPYMSPEQASGSTEDHGPHSDVHALGVLLYELLTGESPFTSVSEIDTIRRIVSQDPPSVRQRRPSLSRDVSAVCQHCLEKQPSRRYRDAGELLADLRRVLDGHPPIARPIGHLGRTWRWATRNRGLASMAVAAVVGLIVGAVGLSALVVQSRRSASLSETQRTVAEHQRATADALRESEFRQRLLAQETRNESLQNSYTSDISLAFLRLHQGHYGEARKLLDRQVPLAGDEDLRTIEWSLLNSEVESRYCVWGKHAGRGTELTVTDRNEDTARAATVVSGALDGNLIFWDAVKGREKRRLSGLHGRLDAITALPSGELLIAGPQWPVFGTSLVAIDPATGKTREVFHSHQTTIESVRVSSDASILASGSRYDNIRCWSATGEKNFTIRNGARNLAFGMSSDGTRLLVSRRHPNALQVWDTTSGTMIDQWNAGSVEQVAVAHHHPYAVYEFRYVNGFGLIRSDNLDQRRWITTDFTPNAFEFSPDDQYLAVADCRSGVELFERAADGEEESEPNLSSQPPNYRSIAYVSGQGGRIEDLEFIGPTEFVTISIDGVVERFAPARSTHDIQTLATANPHSMVAVANPTGMLSLRKDGKLMYFPGGASPSTHADAVAGQRVWPSSSLLTSFALSDDQATIAVSDRTGHVQLLSNWRDLAGELKEPQVRSISMTKLPPSENLGLATFSSTGQFLAIMSDSSELAVFDLSKQESDPALRRSYENNQTCVIFSPQDRYLFIGGFSGIELIDLQSKESSFRLPGEDQVRTACFSPRGNQLIVGSVNGSIACLDQNTGESQFTLHSIDVTGSHSDRLVSMCFVNESRLMTFGAEGSVHFWNVDQRVQLGSFPINPSGSTKTSCECLHVSVRSDALVVALDLKTATEVHRWAWPADSTRTAAPDRNP